MTDFIESMEVIENDDDLLKFDTGLYIKSFHDASCCEKNYLDFEQLPIGSEVKHCDTVGELLDLLKIKDDGFVIKTVDGVPKWVQARSYQNGYYSKSVGLIIGSTNEGSPSVIVIKDGQVEYENEIFSGLEDFK